MVLVSQNTVFLSCIYVNMYVFCIVSKEYSLHDNDSLVFVETSFFTCQVVSFYKCPMSTSKEWVFFIYWIHGHTIFFCFIYSCI